MGLAGKTCLLTGATGGIGRAIGIRLARAGCHLFLTARSADRLRDIEQSIATSFGEDMRPGSYTCDLRSSSEVDQLIGAVHQFRGGCDILINNAGAFLSKALVDCSRADIDDCFLVNVRAPLILTQAMVPTMVRRGWGRIVNVGSSSSYAGFPNGTIYCSTKHAVLGLSRALHAELAQTGIRTFCISPGSVKTEMGRRVPNQNYETFIEPEEVAEYIHFAITFDGNMIVEESRLNRIRQ